MSTELSCDGCVSEEKCYVLVRADMSPGYQIVQSAHAVAELEARHPGSAAGRTMVVLSVPNENELHYYASHILLRGVENWLFWEPDVSEYTALAVAPSEHYYLLEDLKLAGSRPKKRRRLWR